MNYCNVILVVLVVLLGQTEVYSQYTPSLPTSLIEVDIIQERTGRYTLSGKSQGLLLLNIVAEDGTEMYQGFQMGSQHFSLPISTLGWAPGYYHLIASAANFIGVDRIFVIE